MAVLCESDNALLLACSIHFAVVYILSVNWYRWLLLAACRG